MPCGIYFKGLLSFQQPFIQWLKTFCPYVTIPIHFVHYM